MSYGNGSEVAYTYDVFGNIVAMSYDGTEVIRNYTDSAGNINRTQDLLTNLEHRVTYDSTGRLISKEVLDLTATGDRWLRSLEYNFDLNNNVTYISYADKQGSNVTQYEYGLDNLPEKTTLNNGKEVTYTYDTLGRLTGKVLNTTTPLNFAYTYEASDRGSGYTTTKVETEQIGDTTYKYTYDDYGNIEDIYRVNSNNTETLLCSYVYDSYNQLTTVNDYEHSEQTTYTYNQAGNITRRNRYQMNFSWVITATLENVRYVYGDSEWKDLLTTYNGQTIIYDAIGNPLSYRDGISLTWQKGRKLASYSDSNNNITYTYDASGMRTGKAVTTSSGATTNYSYVYESGMLQKMTRGNRILEFSYDANGTPVSIKYRSSATATPIYYYYGINSRGDVVSLYNSDGSVAAIYTYDAYGKLLSVKTSAGIDITGSTSIANMNPLRYRSYIYDNETGFYYLQTRYYDPTTCRFINADGQLNTDSANGFNMFAYCENNPIVRVDDSGRFWLSAILSVVVPIIVTVVPIEKVVCTVKEVKRVKKELDNLPEPSADITDSFRDTLKTNANTVKETTKNEGLIESGKQFYNKVKNGGEWDLKQYSEYQGTFQFNGLVIQAQDIGNINFGYTGKALGLPDSVLLSGAGFAQIMAGTSSFSFVMASNGDDLRDQMYIMYGIMLYNEDH